MKTLPHAPAIGMEIAIQRRLEQCSLSANAHFWPGLPDQQGANGSEELRKLIGVITLCLLTFPALCQSTSKYQVGLITEVKPRQATGDSTSDLASYDVSVKVGDTIYVVLYTPPLGELPPKYVRGREMLVLVGKNTITYNDMLGRSIQVPIQSQRPAEELNPRNS